MVCWTRFRTKVCVKWCRGFQFSTRLHVIYLADATLKIWVELWLNFKWCLFMWYSVYLYSPWFMFLLELQIVLLIFIQKLVRCSDNFFYLPTSLKKYTTNIIYQLPIWYITKSNRYLDNVVIHHMELEEPAAMPCMIHIFFSFFLLKMSTQCICHLSQFSIFVFLTYFQTLIFQEFEIQNNRSSRHHSF